jgi:hypothetical protein
MSIQLEILSKDRALLGFSYNRGSAMSKNKPVIFHEIGIGILVINFYITFY